MGLFLKIWTISDKTFFISFTLLTREMFSKYFAKIAHQKHKRTFTALRAY